MHVENLIRMVSGCERGLALVSMYSWPCIPRCPHLVVCPAALHAQRKVLASWEADRLDTHVLMQTKARFPSRNTKDPSLEVVPTSLPVQTIEHWTDHERLVKSGDHSAGMTVLLLSVY